MSTFGNRLQEAMANAGKSRADVAASIGCKVQTLGLCITGVSASLSAQNTVRAARFLGCDVFWLATGEISDDGTPNPSLTERSSSNGLRLIGRISAALDKNELSSLHIEIIEKLIVTFTEKKIKEIDETS